MAIRFKPEEKRESDPFRRILTFVATRTRHDFSFYKENTLVRRIERFTPEATQLLNLIDSDVGRPIEYISLKMKYETLLEKVSRVMKNLSSIDEEILTKEGHWYPMRIMVYRTEKHIIEGVVLAFINIDAQNKAQDELEKMSSEAVSSAERFAENIVDTARESLLALDGRMRVVKANRSFYRTFRTTAEKTKSKKKLVEMLEKERHAIGSTIMKERVSMFGGNFRVDSQPGKGTHIHEEIPLNR